MLPPAAPPALHRNWFTSLKKRTRAHKVLTQVLLSRVLWVSLLESKDTVARNTIQSRESIRREGQTRVRLSLQLRCWFLLLRYHFLNKRLVDVLSLLPGVEGCIAEDAAFPDEAMPVQSWQKLLKVGQLVSLKARCKVARAILSILDRSRIFSSATMSRVYVRKLVECRVRVVVSSCPP